MLTCETLRESFGTWETSLVSLMGEQCLQPLHVYSFVVDHQNVVIFRRHAPSEGLALQAGCVRWAFKISMF